MADVIKILVVFAVIVVGLRLTKKLPIAVLAATVVAAVLFQLGVWNTIVICAKAIVAPLTLITVAAFYTITFIQRMMEKRGQLDKAEGALNGLFNNRRITASLTPIFLGMMPAAGVVTICGAMVDRAAKDSLTKEEKTFVASYYRHIPESFLPTYSTIIIATQITGVPMSKFLLYTLPLVVVLYFLGYFFYLRKIPKETGLPPSQNRKQDALMLLQCFWTILLTVILILAFGVPVYIAVGISIVLNVFVNKFKWAELKPMFRSAFEARLIVSTICIMMFKDVVIASGAIESLPATFAKLPIPMFLIFVVIFFLGTIISGQQSINVVGLPLAFATMAGAGAPLLVLLQAVGYAAMQMSPTHICLAIASEYFGVSMGALIKKTIPVIGTFIVILCGYYLLLTGLGVS